MDSYLINLDRSTDRLARFRADNAFLPNVQRFPAVNGDALNRDTLVSQRVIDPQLAYSAGDLGCALSHLHLWEMALRNDAPLTVFEDDTVLNQHFARRSTAVLNGLPSDWDIVLWGWNFDTVLVVDFLPGVSQAIVACNQEALRGRLSHYQQLDFDVAAQPLMCAFGLMAYSVSPGGARKLLGNCLPLRPFKLVVGGASFTMDNKSIDIVTNALYSKIRAFVCFPPLAVSPNFRAGSHAQSR